MTLGVWNTAAPTKLTWESGLGSAAVLSFVGAVIIALLTSRPNRYLTTSEKEIKSWLQGRWHDSEISARSRIAQYQAETLESLRDANNARQKLFDKALWLQLLGLVLLSAAVAVRLFV